jgi:hypothetical protein
MTQKPPQETTGYLLAQACKLLRARAHALLGGIGPHPFRIGRAIKRSASYDNEHAEADGEGRVRRA